MGSFVRFVRCGGIPIAGFVAALVACSSERGDEPIGHTAEAVTVCAAGETVKGVDVSVYQGSVDWPTVKAGGLDFAIARISDGMALDTKFAANWPAMKSAGLVRGAYQFFEPADDPAAQAAIVVMAVGMLGDGDLPVTADMEVTGGQSEATIAAHLRTWITAVEAGTGKAPMIYTALGYWNGSVGSTAFSTTPLWVANWGVTCPDLPSAWSGWSFWQNADDGNVGGVTGAVDEDEFNGSLADLQAFAGATTHAGDGGVSDADEGVATDGETVAVDAADAADGASTGFAIDADVDASGGCNVVFGATGARSRWGLAIVGIVLVARQRRRRSARVDGAPDLALEG